MAAIQTVQVELDKIPKDAIRTFKRKDGSTGKAVDLQVTANDEIKYDNNVSVAIAQSKEEREAKENRTFVGNGRVVWTDGNISSFYDLQDGGNGQQVQDVDDELPF